MLIRRAGFLVLILLISRPGFGRIFLRWSEPAMPPAKSLGVTDVVISWAASQGALLQAAKRRGYHVYAEVTPAQARLAAQSSKKMGLSGIIIKADSTVNALAKSLRAAYPSLAVRLLEADGKQPQMRGTMVLGKNRVFQVSSPTRQPWIDSNVALIRFERVYHPWEMPLVGFDWNLIDSAQQQYGPPPEDYELAVAEAGAFHADLILPMHRHLQDELAQGKPGGWKTWSGVRRVIRFYSEDSDDRPTRLMANVGVFTSDYDTSYEEMNLLARHNIPYRVLPPTKLAAGRLDGMALIVVFSPLDSADVDAVQRFAANGGVAVLVGQRGNFPWHSAPPIHKNDEAAVYSAGSGKIVEVATPIVNPEPFAKDVWRLLGAPQRELSLWNALTTLAAVYETRGNSSLRLDLVNYSLNPLRVQVRVKGSFSQARYATPERGCCVSLEPVESGGFTEFIVPQFRVSARVDLSNANAR